MRPYVLAASAILLSMPASAALAPGATAPDFTAQGAIAGKATTITLKAALKKGPVVLYFFPAAFTAGCNAEANAFAEALPDFEKAGASVIGMTAGNVEQLADFSSKHCAGKFPVAAASQQLIKAYDVVLKKPDGSATNLSSRTSYVIAPSGKIIFSHTDMNALSHIRMTLAAVQKHKKTPKR